MSELTYLRNKYCACCTVRCDSRIKRNLRRVYDNDLIINLNNEKIKILTLNKKVLNNTITQPIQPTLYPDISTMHE